MADYRCVIKSDGVRCRLRVKAQGDACAPHQVIAKQRALAQRVPGYVAIPGTYIDMRSETRPEIVHHVYTGEPVYLLGEVLWRTPPHCTCENVRYGDRIVGELFMCKHIRLVIYGEGRS